MVHYMRLGFAAWLVQELYVNECGHDGHDGHGQNRGNRLSKTPL